MTVSHRCVVTVGILVAAGVLSLTSLGASDASCPELVGRWTTGPVRAVAADGATLLFGRGSELVIADAAVAAATAEISRVPLPGLPHDLAVAGTTVLIAADEAGLVVVDIADPVDPVIRAVLPVGTRAEGVAVAGTLAYVAEPWSGLHIIDVSDPGQPVELGLVDPTGFPTGVVVDGDHAYLAVDNDGLVVVDVSDPAAPVEVAALPVWGGADEVVVEGGVAFVAARTNGLVTVDVSDPTAPAEIGQWGTGATVRDVTLRDGRAYLASEGGGLQVVDVTDPASPAHVGSVPTDGTAKAVAVAVAPGPAFVADDFAGLAVVDLDLQSVVARLPGAGESVGVAVAAAGDRAWVTDAAGFVRVLDVLDPAAPVETASLDAAVTLGDLVAVGGHLYVASPDGQLLVLDVADPGPPEPVGAVDVAGRPESLVVAGETAYVAAMSGGLRVFDLAVPADPREIGVWIGPDDVRDVAVLGSHAYVAVQGNGLRVIDVVNPATPFEVGAVIDSPIAVGVAASPGWVYLGAHYAGLRVIDVSDPAAPVDVAFVETPWGAGDVAVSGDLVFVEQGRAGLLVVDVTDPRMPAVVGAWDTPGDLRRLRVAGDRLYVADGPGGCELFEAEGCVGDPPVADFTWSPPSPESGEVVQLTDLSTGLPTSWLWDFGDGVTSTEQNPTHEYASAGTFIVTLTVSNDHGSDTASSDLVIREAQVVPPITTPGEHVLVVPAAANAPGDAGTTWVSDVVLHNPGAEPATVNLYLMAAGADNTHAEGRQVEVPAGGSLRVADVVQSIFGVTGVGGAILVGADRELIVSSRTYNDAATGTFGQYIPGLPIQAAMTSVDEPWLIQLTGTDRFRSNVGIANPATVEMRAAIELYDATGSFVGRRIVTIPPYGWGQLNGVVEDIAGVVLEDARVVISPRRGGDRYFCYGSVVDNASGDPVFVAPQPATSGPLYVAAAAHVEGANQTSWRTDLELVNPGEADVDVVIELLRAGRNNSSPRSARRTVAAGAGLRIVDVLEELFQVTGAAALRITPESGAVIATSRTYNDLVDETYGQYIPAVPASDAGGEGETLRLVQLAHSADGDTGSRTNIGFVNTTGGEIVVTVELFGGDGELLGDLSVRLPPFAYEQSNDVFRDVTGADHPDAFALVRSDTPGAGCLCYASVVDNRSGDPVYIPGR